METQEDKTSLFTCMVGAAAMGGLIAGFVIVGLRIGLTIGLLGIVFLPGAIVLPFAAASLACIPALLFATLVSHLYDDLPQAYHCGHRILWSVLSFLLGMLVAGAALLRMVDHLLQSAFNFGTRG